MTKKVTIRHLYHKGTLYFDSYDVVNTLQIINVKKKYIEEMEKKIIEEMEKKITELRKKYE